MPLVKKTIYKITLGKSVLYIGSTKVSLEKRLNGHRQDAKRYPDNPFYAFVLKRKNKWKGIKITSLQEARGLKQTIARENRWKNDLKPRFKSKIDYPSKKEPRYEVPDLENAPTETVDEWLDLIETDEEDENFKPRTVGGSLYRKRRRRMRQKKLESLTTRQKSAMARHAHHHTKTHLRVMTKEMLKGKTFTQAHKIAMKKVGT